MTAARYPMSQPQWMRHAQIVRLTEPAVSIDVHSYSFVDEPPLSPEEEEALAAVSVPRYIEDRLF